jgi:hypothetical protein
VIALVLISSWGGGIVLGASLVSAVAAVVALVIARHNAKAISQMTALREKQKRES